MQSQSSSDKMVADADDRSQSNSRSMKDDSDWLQLRGIRWRGVFALLGGFLIQLTLGSFYSFGNMMTYMTSYMRVNGSPNLTYADFIVVQSVWGMTQGVTMPISGFLIQIIGPRTAMFGGCFIFSLGSALTYWTLEHSLWTVAVTYGFVSAFGQGIALIPTMTIGMRWFPERKGMAMGIVVGGFGGGAFIFNQIQTAILNPDNIEIDSGGYFTDPDLLSRVPWLMLILAAIYLSVQTIACLMVTEPPSCSVGFHKAADLTKCRGIACKGDEDAESTDFLHRKNEDHDCVEKNPDEKDEDGGSECFRAKWLTPLRQALSRREFYLLWLTRFSVVLVTQTIAGFYKTFGQKFIHDDHFLAFVGAVCSICNCTGRLFYGMLMDKTTYRTAMTTETLLLVLLFSTLYTTTLASSSALAAKALYAAWIWAIFFTFPGTYSTQPAVTTQIFGHRYGGTIYGFLFTSDIVNNLLVGTLSKSVLEAWGYLGLFLILSAFALFAAAITQAFPRVIPAPEEAESQSKSDKHCANQAKD